LGKGKKRYEKKKKKKQGFLVHGSFLKIHQVREYIYRTASNA